MIDYAKIIDNLTVDHIKYILDTLQIPYKEFSTYLLMPTVCHHDDIEEASWKLYYYFNNKIFVCYTEDGNMTIFQFLKQFYETRHINYNWYQDIYRLIVDDEAQFNIQKNNNQYNSILTNYVPNKEVTLSHFNPNVLKCFTKYYPVEWLNDGIDRAAMNKYNICFNPTENKIIIPHYDVKGELVGIRGRALDEWEIQNVGKYMPVCIENVWYSHPLALNLYGLYQNKENIKRAECCILGEGEKAVLQAEQFFDNNIVCAVCGSNLNKYVLHLLLKYCAPREIVIAFDKEELPQQTSYFYKLYNLCKKYKCLCDISFIYDKHNLLKLKQSPFDCGKEVFFKLMKERIKV